MTIEDDLREALHVRAEAFEPSADGLERIESRLSTPPSRRVRLAPRLAAAAVLLLVVGVAGVFALRGSDTGEIAALPASPTAEPTSVSEIENELAPRQEPGNDATSSEVNGGAVTEATEQEFDLPPAPPGVLGPRAASPAEAIDSFLSLIQRSGEDYDFDLEGALARVTRVAENGDAVDVAVLQLGSVVMDDGAPGVVVTQASSPRVTIESPAPLSIVRDERLIVSGEGEGFEATIDVELYSSDDGVWLSRGFADGGNFGVLAPFTAELPLSGGGPAWLVVQSSTGADTGLAPFSAVPLVLDAPQAASEYIVTNIPADDPDGGLVVRSLPGIDDTELGVLPPGLSGIRKRAALSAFVGDGEPMYGDPASFGGEEWWNVWLPDPLENGRNWGWVNRRYLTTDTPVAAADLEEVGTRFVAGLRGDDAAFASLRWDPQGVAFGLSSDLENTTAGRAGLPEFWQATFSFTPPPALIGTLDGNLREVLSPTRQTLDTDDPVDIEVVPAGEVSPYQVVNDELAARFAGASVVRLSDPTNDGSGWRLVALYIRQGAVGPEISGMVAIEWTP